MSPDRSAPLAALLALGGLSFAATASCHSPGDGAASARAFLPDAPLDVAIYDRTSDRMLPMWRHDGDLYVAGEPGHEYEIRLRSAGSGRVLAVTSVDGINVLTGQTAAPGQPGYVIDAWSAGNIDGWRKSLRDVAAFVFTTPRRSYAARTGRPDDVGVIGVAMFREAVDERYASPAWNDAAPAERAAAEREARDRDAPPPAAAATRKSNSAAADTAGAGGRADAGRGPASRHDSTATTAAPAMEPGLGTGHGRRHDSQAERTEFERASERPDAVVRIYYDSLRNLVARGVIAPQPPLARRPPEPFPGGFVADP